MEEIPEELAEGEADAAAQGQDTTQPQKAEAKAEEPVDEAPAGGGLQASQQLTPTLFEKMKKQAAPSDAQAIYSLKQLAKQLQQDQPQIVKEMYVIPPTVTPRQAEVKFREWRQSLWYVALPFSSALLIYRLIGLHRRPSVRSCLCQESGWHTSRTIVCSPQWFLISKRNSKNWEKGSPFGRNFHQRERYTPNKQAHVYDANVPR